MIPTARKSNIYFDFLCTHNRTNTNCAPLPISAEIDARLILQRKRTTGRPVQPPPAPIGKGLPPRRWVPGSRKSAPRDPLATADSGVDKAAPHRARSRRHWNPLRPAEMRSDDPPVLGAFCGNPPPGLARSWTSKPRPWAPSLLSPPFSFLSGGLPGRRSPTRQTAGLHRTTVKVCKPDCEETIAGTRSNGEVAPIAVIGRVQSPRLLSTEAVRKPRRSICA
jgi:hypothetical protein